MEMMERNIIVGNERNFLSSQRERGGGGPGEMSCKSLSLKNMILHRLGRKWIGGT